MATDVDAPDIADDALVTGGDPAGSRGDRQRRTDRRAESVDCTPETLYLTRIAVLEARVEALEGTVAQQERDLQTVVDRYERVLQGRDADPGEPLVDPAAWATGGDCHRAHVAHSPRDADRSQRDPDPDAAGGRDAAPDPDASESDRSPGVVGAALDRLRALL